MSDTKPTDKPKLSEFTLGEIEVTTCHFRDPRSEGGTVYVSTWDDMTWQEFHDRYHDPNYRTEYRHVSGKPMGFGDWCGPKAKFYMLANADCFDPPRYVVRAESVEEAIDTFLDETDACLVTEPDLKDYGDPESDEFCNRLTFDSNGRPHDIESLQCWEVKLIGIETE